MAETRCKYRHTRATQHALCWLPLLARIFARQRLPARFAGKLQLPLLASRAYNGARTSKMPGVAVAGVRWRGTWARNAALTGLPMRSAVGNAGTKSCCAAGWRKMKRRYHCCFTGFIYLRHAGTTAGITTMKPAKRQYAGHCVCCHQRHAALQIRHWLRTQVSCPCGTPAVSFWQKGSCTSKQGEAGCCCSLWCGA